MMFYLDDALEWWCQHERMYPTLSQLAEMLLCIPATSAPAESVFSTAGNLVTDNRNRLKPKHVDIMLFLNKNYHLLP